MSWILVDVICLLVGKRNIAFTASSLLIFYTAKIELEKKLSKEIISTKTYLNYHKLYFIFGCRIKCIRLEFWSTRNVNNEGIPRGLTARIAGFHPAGPGSTPGVGTLLFLSILYISQAYHDFYKMITRESYLLKSNENSKIANM